MCLCCMGYSLIIDYSCCDVVPVHVILCEPDVCRQQSLSTVSFTHNSANQRGSFPHVYDTQQSESQSRTAGISITTLRHNFMCIVDVTLPPLPEKSERRLSKRKSCVGVSLLWSTAKGTTQRVTTSFGESAGTCVCVHMISCFTSCAND